MSTDMGRLRVLGYGLPRSGRLPVEGSQALEDAAMAVDVAQAWALMAANAYPSGDLLVVAMREALQNAVDAIDHAYRGRDGRGRPVPPEYRLEKGTGRFSVTWDNSARTITFEDNGIGMDEETLRTKFLVLGASGKGEDGRSERTVGGFGVAKAVILGISDSGDWELFTRDLHAYPNPDRSGRVHIHRVQTPIQGTRLITRNVAEKYANKNYSALDTEWKSAEARMRILLASCDLPDLTLVLNGRPVPSAFRSGGTRKPDYEALPWGEGVKVQIRTYRRAPGSGYGAVYVRSNGQTQFIRRPTGKGTQKHDVTIDVRTSLSPKDDNYPFPTSREDFKGNAKWAYNDLDEQLSQEAASAVDDQEYDTFILESENEDERNAVEAMADEVREVLGDAALQAILNETLGKIGAFADAEEKRRAVRPAATPKERAGVESDLPGVDRPDPVTVDRISTRAPESSDEAVREIVKVIEGGGERSVSWRAQGAIERAREGRLSEGDLVTLGNEAQAAIERNLDVADSGGMATGLTQAGAVNAALATIAAKQGIAKPRPISPYSKDIAILVSRANYNAKSATWFRKRIPQELPKLIAWDLTLRLIIQEAKISAVASIAAKQGSSRQTLKLRFRPGFILDTSVRGAMKREQGRAYVLINPDYFDDAVRAHKSRPWAIAGYLHNLACHELAHLGEGDHNESWAIEREDLAMATAHLLPAIEEAVASILKLKRKGIPRPDEKAADAKALAKVQKAAADLRQKLDMTERVAKARVFLTSPKGLKRLQALAPGLSREDLILWSIQHEAALVQQLLRAEGES